MYWPALPTVSPTVLTSSQQHQGLTIYAFFFLKPAYTRATTHTFSLPPGDTFTFSDVTRNVLLYRHAGLSNHDDAITFSVSDGISMATTVVQVVVLGAGDNGPQRDPTATLSLEVGEKSSTLIRRSHLAYTVSNRVEC